MSRISLLLVAASVAACVVGCAQCDTCDDFPAPCTGPNCQNRAGILEMAPPSGPAPAPMGMTAPAPMNDTAGPAPVAPPTPPVDPMTPPASADPAMMPK